MKKEYLAPKIDLIQSSLSFKEMIKDERFSKKYPFVMGNTENGEKIYSKMTNLLITGSTGSGKSVFLSSLITSLLYNYGPQDLEIILADMKKIEYEVFEGLPQLYNQRLVTQEYEVLSILNLLIKEMEERYKLFKKLGCYSYEYYENCEEIKENRLAKRSKIIFIIDEFEPLMQPHYKNEFEKCICILAQKSRAVGIHLILSTQNAENNLGSQIKSNFDAKMIFKLLDDTTIEPHEREALKLTGNGDFLFESYNVINRIQSCYLNNQDIKNVVDYIIENNIDPKNRKIKNNIQNEKKDEKEIFEDIKKFLNENDVDSKEVFESFCKEFEDDDDLNEDDSKTDEMVSEVINYINSLDKEYENSTKDKNEISKEVFNKVMDFVNNIKTEEQVVENKYEYNNNTYKIDNDLIKSAIRVCIKSKYANQYLLVRNLNIGFMRATKIMEMLIDLKYIANKPNKLGRYEMIITKEEFEKKYKESL